MTDLDLALITGGFTIAGVVVTFGGNYLLERARGRRADRQARDSAIADLLSASVDLLLAVDIIRGAYRTRTFRWSWLLFVLGLIRDLPDIDSWAGFGDPAVQRAMLRTGAGIIRDAEPGLRVVAADYAGMVMPQASRFFAALTGVTMCPDRKIAEAARQLGNAGSALLETTGARQHKYQRARGHFGREVEKFRAVVDRR